MRILQLHNHHASKGGAMEVLEDERNILENAGHSVRQYTVAATDDLQLSATRAGAKAVWNMHAYRDVREMLRDQRADIAHVHTPFPLMSPSVFHAAKRENVPTVATLHSYRYSCIAATCYRDGRPCEDCVGKRTKWPGLRHRCYHQSFGASAALTASLALHRSIGTFHESVDRFIALTSFSRQLLVRDGIPAEKIIVKPNSVPDPGERPAKDDPADEPYIAFVGRLLTVKGIDTVVEAWALSRPTRLRLRVAGDGPLSALVKDASDQRIDYLGWLSESKVTSLMAGAEAVVVASKWYEAGAPLVTLRSLSVGTPVLTSDLENLSDDIVADNAGLLFRTDDPRSLADRLRQIDRDPSTTATLRANARASYLSRYTPTENKARLESIYQAAVSGVSNC